jgi:hypothetical protein
MTCAAECQNHPIYKVVNIVPEVHLDENMLAEFAMVQPVD